MTTPLYLTSTTATSRTGDRPSRRHLAYHLDYGYHGEASYILPSDPDYTAPLQWRWFPYPTHPGQVVQDAALVIGPRVQASGRPW